MAAALCALAVGGCSARPAGPPRASVEACIGFGITAIEHRLTVTRVPPACRGLSRAQVNFAVLLPAAHGALATATLLFALLAVAGPG